jgi:hypothetical protein
MANARVFFHCQLSAQTHHGLPLNQSKNRAIPGWTESFNGKLRDELLNGEIFYTLKEAQILIERWRREYNTTVRPHSALGYRPPAPEAIAVTPRDPGSAMLRQDLWADLAPTLTYSKTTGSLC